MGKLNDSWYITDIKSCSNYDLTHDSCQGIGSLEMLDTEYDRMNKDVNQMPQDYG